MTVRVLVVVLFLVAFAGASALYRRRQRQLQEGPAAHPLVPAALRAGAHRTWVLFTTPFCASCGRVEARLRASDPTARLVRVDASQERELAGAFAVRSAPTVLLADEQGRVQARLVGSAAVEQYVLNLH